jgi:hypothetical protein
MKIVRVTYTTRPEYSEQNQANVKKVMEDLQNLNHPGIFYSTCMESDQKTFIHTAFFKDGNEQQVLFDLPSFKTFQEQLKSSGPEVPPKQELLSLVGSSNHIFNS